MENPSTPPPSLPESPPRVPDDLLAQLDQANHRFHEARQHLDKAMDDAEFRHQERIDQAEEEFRQAERGLEELTRKIDAAMKPK